MQALIETVKERFKILITQEEAIKCYQEKQTVSPPKTIANANPKDKPSSESRSKEKWIILDEKRIEIKYYFQALVQVSEWLISQKKLQCPVPSLSGNWYLINESGFQPDGKKFAYPVKLSNGFFLETNHGSSDNVKRYCFYLLKYCGVSGQILQVG